MECNCKVCNETVSQLREERDVLLAACKEWVKYFDQLDADSDSTDPLAIARHVFHKARVERTRAAIAAAEGSEK